MNNNNKRGRLILTSRGLNTIIGTRLIGDAIADEDLCGKTILLVSIPEYGVDELLVESCLELGFGEKNITLSGKILNFEWQPDFIYVTEGNTFEVLDYMRKNNLICYIRDCVNNGSTYIGASAGAMIAGTSIELASDFDSNFVRMSDYTGLALFDGIIIPHYEPDELERYIRNTEKSRTECYKSIYSVGNESVLVI